MAPTLGQGLSASSVERKPDTADSWRDLSQSFLESLAKKEALRCAGKVPREITLGKEPQPRGTHFQCSFLTRNSLPRCQMGVFCLGGGEVGKEWRPKAAPEILQRSSCSWRREILFPSPLTRNYRPKRCSPEGRPCQRPPRSPPDGLLLAPPSWGWLGRGSEIRATHGPLLRSPNHKRARTFPLEARRGN